MEIKKEDLLPGIFGEKVIDNKSPVGTVEISVKDLYPSPKNKHRVEMNPAMEELIASIKSNGFLTPLTVRKRTHEDGYEIVSGHRRHFAAIYAGIEKVPCEIKEISDDDMDILIGDYNLQRPHISISEKAHAIKLKYDAIKRKTNGKLLGAPGAPNSEAANVLGAPSAPKGKSADIIADQMGLSTRTINNYIRLTYLIEPLLDMVDAETLPMKSGVQLSYLSEKLQEHVLAIIETEGIKLKEDKAILLKENLTDESDINDVLYILKPELLNPKVAKPKLEIKISKNIKKTYFPKAMTDSQIDELLTELTKEWAENNNPEYEGYKGHAE